MNNDDKVVTVYMSDILAVVLSVAIVVLASIFVIDWQVKQEAEKIQQANAKSISCQDREMEDWIVTFTEGKEGVVTIFELDNGFHVRRKIGNSTTIFDVHSYLHSDFKCTYNKPASECKTLDETREYNNGDCFSSTNGKTINTYDIINDRMKKRQ